MAISGKEGADALFSDPFGSKPLPISLVKPAEKLQPESGLLLFSEFHL